MQFHPTATVLWIQMVCLSWANITLCLKATSLGKWGSHQRLVAMSKPQKNVNSHDHWWLLCLMEAKDFLTILEHITFLYWFNALSHVLDVLSLWYDTFCLKGPVVAAGHGPLTLLFLAYCWGWIIMVEEHDIAEKHTRARARSKIHPPETHAWGPTNFTWLSLLVPTSFE